MAYSYSSSSYKRTVHCSFCREAGHNRASCSLLAQQIEDLRLAHGSDHSSVSYYDRAKAKKEAEAKNRKCSYCDLVGHNRATCSTLASNISLTKTYNDKFRASVLECFKELNFGVGSIIKSNRYRSRRAGGSTFLADRVGPEWKIPLIITRIEWVQINMWPRSWSYTEYENCFYQFKPMNRLGAPNCPAPHLKHEKLLSLFAGTEKASFLLGKNYNDIDWPMRYSRYERDNIDYYLASIESGTSHLNVPVGWLDTDIKVLKRAYKDQKAFSGPILPIDIKLAQIPDQAYELKTS